MLEAQRFVDPHAHLWDLSTGWYPTAALAPDDPLVEAISEVMGDFTKVCGRDFLVPDYLAMASNVCVDKLVHVTCAEVPPRWADETAMAQRWHDEYGLPNAAIGYVSFDQSVADVESDLDQHQQFDVFAGIRHAQGIDYSDDDVLDRLAILERRGLMYDAVAHEHDLASAAQAARRCDGMRFVVEHTGWPTSTTSETFDTWRAGMTSFAEPTNTAVKISGLGMVMHDWTVEDLRPWIEATIDIFGVDRCMFATNFPIDGIYSTYAELLDAFLKLSEAFTDAEREQLVATNAERWYGI